MAEQPNRIGGAIVPKRAVRHDVVQPSDDSIRLIPLTQGQTAVIDACDFELISQFEWVAHWMPKMRKFRAVSRTGGTMTYMNRLILGLKKGDPSRGDHRDGDTLNNRRSNLRIASQSQNGMNRGRTSRCRSGYKGVRRHRQKWVAQIAAAKKHKYLGIYSSVEDAARAYDRAAVELHGEFAVTNFPKESYL